MSESIEDRQIVVTREFAAPRELVFAAWTERQHVENWWVPKGTVFHEWNPQPGGRWRYTQPGPDGAQYPFKIEFIEIDKPNRLVYDFGADAEGAPEPVRTSLTFEEQAGVTKVTLQLLFPSVAALEEAAKYGAKNGAKHALENLATYLASATNG